MRSIRDIRNILGYGVKSSFLNAGPYCTEQVDTLLTHPIILLCKRQSVRNFFTFLLDIKDRSTLNKES